MRAWRLIADLQEGVEEEEEEEERKIIHFADV